jgi:tRNA (mo5U34)-methyltransferase
MSVYDYSVVLAALAEKGAPDWSAQLRAQLPQIFDATLHGDWPRWQQLVQCLPDWVPDSIDLHNAVRVGSLQQIDAAQRAALIDVLMQLHPWRKGPYSLYGVEIDTEWRSDWKWDRVLPHITPLYNRWVLDVGCGNGYHCWRMLGEGAQRVIGIDPTLLSVLQFQAIKKLHGDAPIDVLPLGLEQLPSALQLFDTVFSMGVLYHRRSPFDHLLELRDCLRPGGELVLETLVIEGDERQVLVPGPRYAQMRNVWFIPSPDALCGWLGRCGFRNVRVVDVTPTTRQEQRSTEWMRFHSLADFLDPLDASRTLEGYPAPVRAVLIAGKE